MTETEKDTLFDEAAELVVQCQKASSAFLQLKFKLGYSRANRIIQQLEAAGIVGAQTGTIARMVKFTDVFSLKQHLKTL